jgi:hypothetical protein
MRHLISTQSLAAVAGALGTFAVASSAHARSDVYFSIGVHVPGAYVQPAPVYVQPRASYHPAHDNYRRYGDLDCDGIKNRNDRDRDGDGVRNRHDRRPDNPYSR